MDSPYTAKLLSIYKRGVITAPEFANALLVDLIKDGGPEAELPSLVAGLPNEVAQTFRELLIEVQREDYRWRPFVLGPDGTDLRTEADDSARLRRICAALHLGSAT